MEEVGKKLGDFLTEECKRLPSSGPKPTVGIFLAGYSTDTRVGGRWERGRAWENDGS